MYKLISVLAIAVSAKAQSTAGITVTPAAVTFQYQLGAATLPAAQTLQVKSVPAALTISVAVSGTQFNGAWLLVSAYVGTSPMALKVETNPTGLPSGVYTGTLTFTAVSGGTTLTQNTTVTLDVASPPATISTSPAALTFTYVTGNPIPAASLTSAFILASNGAPLSATISVSGATWLTVTPTGQISLIGLFNTITVTVNPTGLVPKVYSGTITIAAPAATNKTLTLPVTLTVDAAPPSTIGTWPLGVIQGSGSSVVTVEGNNFFPTSTASVTGFTPAATITVNDGVNAVSETVLIPVYLSTFTGLALAVSSPLPAGAVTAAYSQTLAATGGTSPYTFAIIGGNVPPGLSIVGSTLSGTPSAAGTYTFTIQVADSSTPVIVTYSQVQVTILPVGSLALNITTAAAPLGTGIVGTAYGPVTLTATGGAGPPYTWAATGLTNGLSLSPAGVLSGTPSTDGSAGIVAVAAVSDSALLATIPNADLAIAGVLRIAVTTPTPGGGTSNEASFQVYGPAPQITAVVNSASYEQGTLAPGDMIAIFGLGLGPAMLTIFDPSVPPIPTSLPAAGSATLVTINGTPAPIIYTSANVVGVIVPYTTVGPTAQIIVTYGGLVSQAFTMAVAASDPGVYSSAASGQGQGAILNYNSITNNYTINSAALAAARGSTVVMYITGAGTTTSAVYNTLIPAAPAITPALTPTVTIGGQAAPVQGAQAPPGSIPGIIQLNVTVPTTATPGPALPVIVTVGGVASQTGLTMAVK
ncbi:MAG: putative Ig domain-containing protein [Bryobacteraceae bacterium]